MPVMNNTGQPTPDDIERLLDQAQSAIDELQNESSLETLSTTENFTQPHSVSLSKIIGAFSSPDSAINLNAIRDLQLDVRVVLGEAELTLEDVMRLRKGSVVQLNAKCADPVSILVNGQLVARGEALNRNGKFCVRLTEILIK